jgi:hypothetical protein
MLAEGWGFRIWWSIEKGKDLILLKEGEKTFLETLNVPQNIYNMGLYL